MEQDSLSPQFRSQNEPQHHEDDDTEVSLVRVESTANPSISENGVVGEDVAVAFHRSSLEIFYRRIYSPRSEKERIVDQFICMSILFSANHGCVVACLGLASARLGATGIWQSGLL